MTDRQTLTIGESAQVDYIADQVRLDDDALDMAAKGAPLTAATFRNYARIAYRAGRAEKNDPEPPLVVRCDRCGGVRVCDLAVHGGSDGV